MRKLAPVPTSVAMRINTATQAWIENALFHAGPWTGKANTYVLHRVTVYSHTATVPTLWPLEELGSTCVLGLATALALLGAWVHKLGIWALPALYQVLPSRA